MTPQEFLDKYLGTSQGYPEGSYVGQCLSIVKLYIKEVLGLSNPPPSGSGSAYGYWSKFPSPLDTVLEKVPNTPDLVPEEGWIAVWKPWSSNQYGHIAIVAKGSTTGTLKNHAQNWTSKTFQLESNRYTNVIGFLKPKVYNQSDMDPITKFIKENNITEGQLREGFAYVKDQTVPKLEKEIEVLKTSQKDLEARLGELEAKVSESEENSENWQKKYETANKTLAKKLEEFDIIDNERKQWKSRYEAKCLETADKLNSWELFKLFIKKLSWKK